MPSVLHRKPGELCFVRPRYAYSDFSGVMNEPCNAQRRFSYVDVVSRSTMLLVISVVDHGWGEDVLALLPTGRIGWLVGDDVVPA